MKKMLENTSRQEKQRLCILEGVSKDLKIPEISAQLGINRWEIIRQIRSMRYNGDIGFKQAEEAQALVREKKSLLLTKEKRYFKQNERFLNSTGITLQEKSFRNMVDFNRFELMKIMKSEQQHAEINKLPKNIQRTLVKNGIIIKGYRDNVITERAQNYLTKKNPKHKLKPE
jgi:hypothetical protein